MTKPKPFFVVGLHGRARTGKDTVADLIVRNFSGFHKLAFATPFNRGLCAMFDLTEEELDRLKDDPTFHLGCPEGPTIRQAKQTLGTDWAQTLFGKDIWVFRVHLEIQRILQAEPNINSFVISDVRTETEAKFVRRYGQLLFLMRDPSHAVNNHPSEWGIRMAPCDRWLDNRSLEGLADRVSEAIDWDMQRTILHQK